MKYIDIYLLYGGFYMQMMMYFLHMLGAISMGFYAILPFIVKQLRQVEGAGQEGLLVSVSKANRYAQYLLVTQLITGGYLMSKGSYSVLWMVWTMIVVLAIGACGGLMGKQVSYALQGLKHVQVGEEVMKKIYYFSLLIFVLFITLIALMVYRT